jgi:hypothetical protein
MHYIGMAGLEFCSAIYTVPGVVVSSVVAIALCSLAFWVAYGRRTNRNILIGTFCFAGAVCSVHFLAMSETNFVAVAQSSEFGPRMSNEVLALGVIVSSFVIFGAFLWVGITYLVAAPAEAALETAASKPTAFGAGLQIPCERDGGKVFVSSRDVIMLQADGHYTRIYTKQDCLFCAWPITEATKRLLPAGFLQTHRSYLVNPAMVSRFERSKDKGRCVFDFANQPSAPVSRSKLKEIQNALLSQSGAIRAG